MKPRGAGHPTRAEREQRRRARRDADTLAAAYGLSDEARDGLKAVLSGADLVTVGEEGWPAGEELLAAGLATERSFSTRPSRRGVLLDSELYMSRGHLRRLARAARAVEEG